MTMIVHGVVSAFWKTPVYQLKCVTNIFNSSHFIPFSFMTLYVSC